MKQNPLFFTPTFSDEQNEALQLSVNRCLNRLKFHLSKSTVDPEEEILTLPVCARAPLLALYFIKYDNAGADEKMHLLLLLYKIAVRIYDRHVLPNGYHQEYGYSRYAGEDAEKAFQVLLSSLFEDCEPNESPEAEWHTLRTDEILADLTRKMPISLNCLQKKYFYILVLQILAGYAADKMTLAAMLRKEPASSEKGFAEEMYKYHWQRFRLPRLSSQIERDLPTEDEYGLFFHNFSLC